LLGTTFMTEMKNELDRATVSGFKSRHDDAIDTVSMLAEMKPWKPMAGTGKGGNGYDDPFYDDDGDDNTSQYGSYII